MVLSVCFQPFSNSTLLVFFVVFIFTIPVVCYLFCFRINLKILLYYLLLILGIFVFSQMIVGEMHGNDFSSLLDLCLCL